MAERPGDRYWKVVRPIKAAVSIHDGAEAFLSGYSAVPRRAGHLLAAHWCQSEVRNGGLLQFFSNSTGVLAPEALAGFRAIGLEEWADILAGAMQIFGEPYPRDRDERRASLSGNGKEPKEDDPFADLDERFFAWLSEEPNRWERLADRYSEVVDV